MAGKRVRYGLQSMFWSDLENVDVRFTAVGLVDSTLASVAVWNISSRPIEGAPSANDYTSGVVWYVRDGVVVGALLWNPKQGAGALRLARQVIGRKLRVETLTNEDFVKLIPLDSTPFRAMVRTRATNEDLDSHGEAS